MKIDRMYFQNFEKVILDHPIIKQQAEANQWDELLDYIEKNILNKPEEYFTLEKLRKTINGIDASLYAKLSKKFLSSYQNLNLKKNS